MAENFPNLLVSAVDFVHDVPPLLRHSAAPATPTAQAVKKKSSIELILRANLTTVHRGSDAAQTPCAEEGLDAALSDMVGVDALHALESTWNAPTPDTHDRVFAAPE